MEEQVTLKHPEGKKSIMMGRTQYDQLSRLLLDILDQYHEMTHRELFEIAAGSLAASSFSSKGSFNWYLEWVKLDLEARKLICRKAGKKPVVYTFCQ